MMGATCGAGTAHSFEEIYIFSNGGHLGWKAWLSDITFKGNPLRMIQAKFGLNWPKNVITDPE
jgi:hypothetical protein